MAGLAGIKTLENAEATALLQDAAFVGRWQELAAGCRWATRFQSPEFILPWYVVYAATNRPLIVLEMAADGSLIGALFLAVMRDGRLQAAGGRQAEYQCWLAAPQSETEFPLRALAEVSRRVTKQPLGLHYLPPELPLDWTSSPSAAPCDLETLPRPVMALSLEEIERTWKKKIKNSRLNQLPAELTLERVSSVNGLREVLGEIAVLYDLRQASMFGSMPFHDDPEKARFHLELMKHPGLLDVTLLRVENRIFSAHIGVVSRGVVHVGMLVHSPLFSRYSPGRTHMLYLARDLARAGVPLLDLTPGDDPWKERFATSHDQVRRLRLFGVAADLRREARSREVLGRIKTAGAKVGISPKNAARVASALRGKSAGQIVTALVGRARAIFPRTVELRAYTMDLAEGRSSDGAVARRDMMEDLLNFEEQRDTPTRQAFLKNALARLEEGHHCYTVVDAGRLVHWGWLAEGQKRGFMDEVHQHYSFPEASVTLYDFYTHPAFRGRGHYGKTLRQMLADATSAGHNQAFIFVTADNGPSRHVIEKTGFVYKSSLFERTSFGQTSRSRSDGPVEVEPDSGDSQTPAPSISS